MRQFTNTYVSKAWSFAPNQEYFKDVCLNGKKIIRLQSILDSPKYQIPQLIGHGEFVQCFRIQDDNKQDQRLSKQQFKSLLLQLLYLKTINMGSSRRTMFYLDHLFKIVKSKTINDEDLLKRVQKILISYDYKVTSKPHYFQLCYSLRSSLTHFRLNHPEIQLITLDDLAGRYWHFLPHFKNLTHLHICSRTSIHGWKRDGGVSNISVQSILEACPQLIDFMINSDFPIAHDTYNSNTFSEVLLASSKNDVISTCMLWNEQENKEDFMKNAVDHQKFSAHLFLHSHSSNCWHIVQRIFQF
jgi:hypothetical protein